MPLHDFLSHSPFSESLPDEEGFSRAWERLGWGLCTKLSTCESSCRMGAALPPHCSGQIVLDKRILAANSPPRDLLTVSVPEDRD